MVRMLIPVAALFLCWITVFGSASLTYFVDSFDYNLHESAIARIREDLAKNGSVSHGIPVLPPHVSTTSELRFVLVTLAKVGYYSTLVLDVVTADIVGFRVGANSYFFHNVYDALHDNPLFNDTKKARLPFDVSYESLKAHGASRWNTELGTRPLNDAAVQIYNYDSDHSINIAHSFLVVTQMIVEAVRSNYISNQLKANFINGFVPKCDIFSLEDQWVPLSFEIQKSNNGNFSHPVVLQYATCATYEVSTVDEVKSKMALLYATSLRSHDEQTKGNFIKKLSSAVM